MSSSIAQLLQTGLELHRSGRLQEAESYYQSAREQQPEHPDAWHLLGVLAHQVGKNTIAVELVQEAIKRHPDNPEFYVTCGEAYRALQEYDLAVTCLEQALSKKPDFAGAHVNIGNIFKEMGLLGQAEEHIIKAIGIQPDFAVAHNNLGVILKETNREEEAIDCFRTAIETMPGHFEAYNNLGNALFNLKRIDEARQRYEQALTLMPDYAEAHSNLGNALKELGNLGEALTHYERAIAIKPDFAMAYYNLGTALDDLGRPEDAITRYEQALAIQPDYAEAHNNLGNALDEVGLQEEAISHYGEAVEIKPDYTEAYRNLTRLQPKQVQASVLEKLLTTPSLSEKEAIDCHFALGNIFDDGDDFARAFEHYSKGNVLKRKTVMYDSQSFSAYVDRLIEAYSEQYFRDINEFGSDTESPVFVLGMPRSGTSLVEQIVASHPQVHGAGELPFLVHVEEGMAERLKASGPYPECMQSLSQSSAREFSQKYLGELEAYADNILRITDKLPSNFLRVGLIKTLFPKAKIIHCRRNAMDTCTSNFLNYFSFGNDYSFDLEELGKYYLDYERLMRHWESLFSSEILTVQYEALVADQEKVSRQLVEYIGLPWDDCCLDFYKSKRAVNTFSSSQVRKPVYTQSINRWQLYEQQLAPLSAILNRA
tara:strand:- start:83075 stop:85036 length:1962 start_codon:yes stop_codon:yes gene_type:complete